VKDDSKRWSGKNMFRLGGSSLVAARLRYCLRTLVNQIFGESTTEIGCRIRTDELQIEKNMTANR